MIRLEINPIVDRVLLIIRRSHPRYDRNDRLIGKSARIQAEKCLEKQTELDIALETARKTTLKSDIAIEIALKRFNA